MSRVLHRWMKGFLKTTLHMCNKNDISLRLRGAYKTAVGAIIIVWIVIISLVWKGDFKYRHSAFKWRFTLGLTVFVLSSSMAVWERPLLPKLPKYMITPWRYKQQAYQYINICSIKLNVINTNLTDIRTLCDTLYVRKYMKDLFLLQSICLV